MKFSVITGRFKRIFGNLSDTYVDTWGNGPQRGMALHRGELCFILPELRIGNSPLCFRGEGVSFTD